MGDVAERTLPHNLEAERSVLGAVLLHPEALAVAVSHGLVGAAYFRDAHRRIFEAMQALAARDVTIDLVTLKEELGRKSELEEVGGPAYISALVDGVPRSANVEHYTELLLEKQRLRQTIAAANKVLARAYDGEATSAAIIESGVDALMLVAPATRHEPVPIGTAVSDYILSLDQAETVGVVPTGFTDLDEILGGGLHRQELTVLAARPSVGKSALALQMATASARIGSPAVLFSIEMSTRSLAARATAGEARIDLSRLAGRFLGERDWGKLSQAAGHFMEVPLVLDDTSTSLLEIVAWCRRLKQRECGLVTVFIDYLQMLSPGQERTREQEVASISRTAKRLAKEENLAVVGLSQLSRAPEARSDKRPHLSDLRESGALEQDADVALLLFRADMYENAREDDKGVAEVIVAKQRNGPTGTVKLVYIREFTRFENLAVGG
jgi:replicative DNA helicase